MRFLNANAQRGINNNSLLNYAMVVDEPDYEEYESEEDNAIPKDFYMNINSQKNPKLFQINEKPSRFTPAPFMNPS